MTLHPDVVALIEPDQIEGDLKLVAEQCGLDVAVRLHAGMAGCLVNVRKSAFKAAVERYVRQHYDGRNVQQLATRCGLTERAIYAIVAAAPIKNDQHRLV